MLEKEILHYGLKNGPREGSKLILLIGHTLHALYYFLINLNFLEIQSNPQLLLPNVMLYLPHSL